jgi:hypothetical protein
MSAIKRESSALCSNCSLLISSSTSDAAIALPVFNIRFCNASIFPNVLSKKGAENLTPSPFAFGSRISSLRGVFLPLVCGDSGSGPLLCFPLEWHPQKKIIVTYGTGRSAKVTFSAISATRLAILEAMISKGEAPFAA